MSEMTREELLPCPFCGREPQQRLKHVEGGQSYLGIRCEHHTDWITIEQWNRRALTARSEGFREGVEAAAGVCEGYAQEGERTGKEYVHETIAELVARLRALSPRETDAKTEADRQIAIGLEYLRKKVQDEPTSAPSSDVGEMVRRLKTEGDDAYHSGRALTGLLLHQAAALLSKVGQGLDRALKNEAAFHCLLYHCQQALSMHGPHSFDEELSKGVKAAIAISHGERSMSLHFDNDWLRKTTEADPDVDIEAAHPHRSAHD